tara:strand:- start:2272 stop:3054 length:783 start_codon:yes stop_codon:yes gene_type:complete
MALKKNIILFLIISLSSFKVFVEENRGLEIALMADANTSGFIDSRSNMRMLLKNKKGQITERSMQSKIMEVEGDGDKSLIVFKTPRDVRGIAVLGYAHKMKTDDQWLYMPALKRVKRIVSKNRSGPFLGSEFSLEDLSFQEIEKFSYSYIGEEQLNEKDCYLIERTPLDPYSGYTKQRVWVEKENYLILKIEHFDRKFSHLKTQYFRGFNKYLNKFWRPSEIEMINHQTKKSTTLLMEDMVFQNGFTERDFSQNSLKRSK